MKLNDEMMNIIMKLLGMHAMYQLDIMSVTSSPAFVLLLLCVSAESSLALYYRFYLTAIISLLADS